MRWISKLPKAYSLLLGLAIILVSLFMHVAPVAAANPTTISFQGKVVNANGTNVTDGSYTFLFKLYTVSSAGTAVWTETQTGVTVTSGVFQVNLGSVCSFFTAATCNNNTPIDFNANPALYLGITFNSDAAGEMTPRVQLQSVPYAYNADKVGGLSVSQLVQLSPSAQQTGTINVSGTGTYGGALTAVGVNAGTGLIQGTGGATLSGALQDTGTETVQNGTYTSNEVLINDGQTSAPPAFPSSYTPALTVITNETSGSRPLFFAYNSGSAYAALLDSGACGAFTQMCLDLGNGATSYTALENIGSTLNVGGGDDGNFTTTSLLSTATNVGGTLGVTGLATLNGGLSVTTITASGLASLNAGTTTTTLTASGAANLNGGTSTTTLTSTGQTSLSGSTTFATSGDIYGSGFDYFDPSAETGAIGTTGINSGVATGGAFGGAFDSGAFIGNDDSYSQDFVSSKAVATTNNAAVGDDGKWYFNNNAQAIVSYTGVSATGGYARLTSGATTGRGGLVVEGATAGTIDGTLAAANLPIVQMKVRTSVAIATDDVVFGMMDTATAPVANDTLPTNGIVFWTDNSTGTTGWQGVIRKGGVSEATVTCPTTADVTVNEFAVGRIVVVNTTTVRFYMDSSVAGGVNLIDCGAATVTAANMPTVAMAMGMYVVQTNATTGSTFDLDYARFWQDDAAPTNTDQAEADSTEEQTEADIATGTGTDSTTDPTQAVTDDTSPVDAAQTTTTDSDSSPPIQTDITTPATNSSNLVINSNSSSSFNMTDAAGNTVATIDDSGNATFNGNLNLPNGALTIGGDVNVGGLSTFQKLATFLAKTVFKQDVEIDGHLTVGVDSAGYASLRTGETTVHVTFKSPYDSAPIVNANITSGQFADVTVTNITAQGFDINLAAPATEATTFSWTAIGVTNPLTATNPLPATPAVTSSD